MFISPVIVAAKSQCSVCKASVNAIEPHLKKAHPTLSREEYTEAVQKAFREMKALVAAETRKSIKAHKKNTFKVPKAELSSSTGRIVRDRRLGRDASHPAQGGRVESNRRKH
jgi:hypothetical protein